MSARLRNVFAGKLGMPAIAVPTAGGEQGPAGAAPGGPDAPTPPGEPVPGSSADAGQNL